jgi:hypothetical protein
MQLSDELAAWMFAIAPDLNRSVAFVRVLEPFAAWARLDPNFSHVTVESLNDEGTAYLLPDVLMAGDEEKLFRKYWRDIFDHELYAWSTDEREWPQRRTYAMFREWFNIQFSSLCYDLVEAPVEERGG